jgi:hypothetical protein
MFFFFVTKGIHFHKGAKMKISLSYEQNTAMVVETVVETVANLSNATVIFKLSQEKCCKVLIFL